MAEGMYLFKKYLSRLFQRQQFYPVVLLFLVLAISIVHYYTPVEKHHYHDLLRRLYYLPLFLALFRYGLKGGILISLFITLAYLPHFFLQQGGFTSANVAKIFEICFLFVLSVVFGVLQNRTIKTGRQLDESNKKLTEANSNLRKKTLQLIEVEKSIRLVDRIKTIADLTASFAHEIKNPLASLIGAAQICAKEGAGTVRKFAGIVGEEAKRLDAILMNFLVFVKEKDAPLTSVNLLKVVIHSIELARLIAGEREIVLQKDLEHDLFVEENEGALSQAIFNLLKNSIEATDSEKGKIVVQVVEQSDLFLVQVRDNGSGMSITEDPFAPFITSKDDGTGLGLTITYKIVDSLAGTIRWFREGAETVFEIALPQKASRGML